jgi:hypothetical protein
MVLVESGLFYVVVRKVSLARVSRHLGKRRSRSCAGAKSWPNCWLELPLCFAVSCQSKAELLRSPDN